jgi:hypothetical protein
VESRPIWAIYPDPFATALEDAGYIYDRHILTKHKLRQIARRPGFYREAIAEYIKTMPQGDLSQKQTFESELQSLAPDDWTNVKDKYELLERWGFVDGALLQACGCPVDDPLIEYEARIWLLGTLVVGMTINPFKRKTRPYHFYYWEKDESSIWGAGIAANMRDIQRLFNGTCRMIQDNAALASGPQVEVNTDLTDEDDIEVLTPFRVWTRTGEGIEAGEPMMRVHDFPSHLGELLPLARWWLELGDETTAIPRFVYAQPQGGAARTVGGLSMLLGQANITLKDGARNWDDGITTPFITALYDWEMQFGSEPLCKGDYQVVARGSSSLVAKEIRVQALREFRTTTANPLDAPLVNRLDVLRAEAMAMDLPTSMVKTDEQYEQMTKEQNMALQLQAQVGQMAEEMQKMQDALQKAGIQLQATEKQLEEARDDSATKLKMLDIGGKLAVARAGREQKAQDALEQEAAGIDEGVNRAFLEQAHGDQST